ncbi:glycosyltransferase family 4 protein [Flavobacterium sp. PLA-1-15]|uniref:glycosyltransferase family 4 protein n=1 Tax=Flavobacterium sp. PLA-1-15 TaxID=3380533 RepID=UPI003B7CF29A
MKKLIRITTVPLSLDKLLSGQLKFMSSFYNVIAISSDSEALKKISEKEGVAVFPVEMTRKITPFQDTKAVWELFKYLKKEKPFIVHTHTPKAGIVGMLAAKMAGVPNRLHTVAGLPLLEAKGSKRKVLDLVEKLTYSCATGVYPNSFGLEKIILDNKYCDSKKLKVLANGSSNGIDTAFFSPDLIGSEQRLNLRQSLNIQEDDYVFIFVGRLVSDKGITELVRAFENVNKENSKTKLLLVGPLESDLDPLSKETEKSIQENESILTVGYQNDVRPYFGIADVLTFPSYREGFPNVVLQAGAMGLPCIVSNINGCNEIIIENNNGLIVPVKNTEKLEKAMRRILDDQDLMKHLQFNSRKRIIENYEQKVIWEAILKEYKNLEKSIQ